MFAGSLPIASVYTGIAVLTGLLVLAVYLRGGAEALRQNATRIALLLVGSIVLMVAIAIVSTRGQ